METKIIGIIGTGKIAIGPLCAHDLLSPYKKILINRISDKWEEPINKGFLYVTNIATKSTIKIPVTTKFEDIFKNQSSENIIFLYDNLEDRDKLLKELNACFISVGKSVKDVVINLPKQNYPIVLLENDYDLLCDIRDNINYNDLHLAVLDCHSPMWNLSGNTLKLGFTSEMKLQILDDNLYLRKLFSKSSDNVIFCDSKEQLDVFHMKKFYGVNISHRILAYLLLDEQFRKEGYFIYDDMSRFFSDELLDKYRNFSKAIIIASYLEEHKTIQKFYDVASFEEGFSIYLDTLVQLSDYIAKKTIDNGDTFSRVIKYTTKDFNLRIEQTKNVIKQLLESVKSKIIPIENDNNLINWADTINWTVTMLSEELNLLDKICKLNKC